MCGRVADRNFTTESWLEDGFSHKMLYRLRVVDGSEWGISFFSGYKWAMRNAADLRFESHWWTNSLEAAGVELPTVY